MAGITIHQNYELGIIYIQGAEKQGERLTKLTTLYLLLLKLIYDEKMRRCQAAPRPLPRWVS